MQLTLFRITARIFLLSAFVISPSFADDPILLLKTDLQYVGAFRVTLVTQEEGKIGFAPGRIAVSSSSNTLFINGLDTSAGNSKITIAEYQIPKIVNSTNIEDLLFTGPPIQDFSSFYNRIPYKTTGENIRDIAGMELINNKLYVSTFDPYDAKGNAVDNMFRIENPFDLSNSEVTGYFNIENRTLAAGWMSTIPIHLQAELGGDYMFGMARQASINHRWSMGPSAFSFTLSNLTNVKNGETVPNNKLQNYPVDNRLAPDSFNYPRPYTEECPSFVEDNSLWKESCVLGNDLWTELANAYYGAIIPGTNTYLTVGRMGGVRKGIAYKNSPVGFNGNCSGECPYEWSDWDNYIWLFDVQDMIDYKNGATSEYDARPYEYGAIKLPFDDLDGDGVISLISGADYDAAQNRLYLTLTQGGETAPIILVYEIALNRPKAPVISKP